MSIRNWSYSLLTVFESCKYRVKLARIDKIPDDTPRPNADRGRRFIREAEDYVTGKALSLITSGSSKQTSPSVRTTPLAVICEEEWVLTSTGRSLTGNQDGSKLKCDAVIPPYCKSHRKLQTGNDSVRNKTR